MAAIISTKPCSGCNQTLDQSAYSNAQWKKGSAKTCKSCVEAAAAGGSGESKKPEKKLAKPVVDEIKAGAFVFLFCRFLVCLFVCCCLFLFLF